MGMKMKVGEATNTTLGGGAAEGCQNTMVINIFND